MKGEEKMKEMKEIQNVIVFNKQAWLKDNEMLFKKDTFRAILSHKQFTQAMKLKNTIKSFELIQRNLYINSKCKKFNLYEIQPLTIQREFAIKIPNKL